MLAALDTSPTVTVPLTRGDDGAIRITGTRITLPVLLTYVRQGLTPDQIASEVFDTLSVADIHAVLAWVHLHAEEVDAYLADHERKSADHEARARGAESPGVKRLRKLSHERS